MLIELDVILAQKTRTLEQNAADAEAHNHIEVLEQVCDVSVVLTRRVC